MNDFDLKEQLIHLREGDKAAFERIYAQLSMPIYTVILRMTCDRMLAEDILQEFFIKLFHSPPKETVREPRAYLFRTARNLAIDALRKRRSEEPYDESVGKEEENVAERIDLEAAFERLEQEDRQIVSLRINGDLKFREIAEIIEKPLGTVLWKYRRAIDQLRDLLNGGAE